MMTEEDFENAEAAIQTIDEAYKNNHLFGLTLSVAEKTLYEFAKKVLAEARRDFLTEVKTAQVKAETVDLQEIANIIDFEIVDSTTNNSEGIQMASEVTKMNAVISISQHYNIMGKE